MKQDGQLMIEALGIILVVSLLLPPLLRCADRALHFSSQLKLILAETLDSDRWSKDDFTSDRCAAHNFYQGSMLLTCTRDEHGAKPSQFAFVMEAE